MALKDHRLTASRIVNSVLTKNSIIKKFEAVLKTHAFKNYVNFES